jgi:hypothetical protein
MYVRNNVPHPNSSGECFIDRQSYGHNNANPLDFNSKFLSKPYNANHKLFHMKNQHYGPSHTNRNNYLGSNQDFMDQNPMSRQHISNMPGLNQLAQSQNNCVRQSVAQQTPCNNFNYRTNSNDVTRTQQAQFEAHRQALQKSGAVTMPIRNITPMVKHRANAMVKPHDTRPIHQNRPRNEAVRGSKSRNPSSSNSKYNPRRPNNRNKRYHSEGSTDAEDFHYKPNGSNKASASSSHKRKKSSDSFSDSDSLSTTSGVFHEVYNMSRLDLHTSIDPASERKLLESRLKTMQFCTVSSNEVNGFIIPCLSTIL